MPKMDNTSVDKLADIANKIFASYDHHLNVLTPSDEKKLTVSVKSWKN